MAAGAGVVRYVHDQETLTALLGLKKCCQLHDACRDETDAREWSALREGVRESFETFMQACRIDAPAAMAAWRDGMRATMGALTEALNGAEQLAIKALVKTPLLRHVASTDTQERLLQEVSAQENMTEKNRQAVLEQYMLLVHASLLLEPCGAREQRTFEFMHGIEFPGLWSRSLYGDATPTKKYRNMLVGNRPRGFACEKKVGDLWLESLKTIRRLINRVIPARHRSLLSEHRTNLAYAGNVLQNDASIGEPMGENCVPDTDSWCIPGPEEGSITPDVAEFNFILPTFIGKACGAVFRKGYLFMLTTEGEIFRLQISQLQDGVLQHLISDPTKCIVDYPNKAVITRLHFEKDTERFPALQHTWKEREYDGLRPTCLVNGPAGCLFVVSAERRAIYKIHLSATGFGGMATISLHAGQPEQARGSNHLAVGQTQDEKNVDFFEPRCAVLDGDENLWVCDGTWLRKITYEVGNRSRFTVSNVVDFGVDPTCMALGRKGLVFVHHVWHPLMGAYQPILRDVLMHTNLETGKLETKTLTIKHLGLETVGSVVLDSKDQVVFAARQRLRSIERSDVEWTKKEGRFAPMPHRSYEDDDMSDLLLQETKLDITSMCYLAWWHGNVAVFATSRTGVPYMSMYGSNAHNRAKESAQKRAAEGAADGDAGARGVVARNGTLTALLRQLAELQCESEPQHTRSTQA